MKKRIILIAIVAICAILFLSGRPIEEEETPAPVATPTATNLVEIYRRNPEIIENRMQYKYLAKTAYAICPDGASEDCIIAVMSCIFNRTRTAGFPNTIKEVCEQKNQWQLQNTADVPYNIEALAERKLTEWQRRGYSEQLDVVYIIAESHGFQLRSEWDGDNEIYILYF